MRIELNEGESEMKNLLSELEAILKDVKEISRKCSEINGRNGGGNNEGR